MAAASLTTRPYSPKNGSQAVLPTNVTPMFGTILNPMRHRKMALTFRLWLRWFQEIQKKTSKNATTTPAINHQALPTLAPPSPPISTISIRHCTLSHRQNQCGYHHRCNRQCRFQRCVCFSTAATAKAASVTAATYAGRGAAAAISSMPTTEVQGLFPLISKSKLYQYID